MVLERVFECPRTLRRLHSGPLGKLLEGFCNWLLEHGFRRVRYSVNRFLDYRRDYGLFDPSSGQEIYQPLLDAYLKWMNYYQHASEGTLEVRRHSK